MAHVTITGRKCSYPSTGKYDTLPILHLSCNNKATWQVAFSNYPGTVKVAGNCNYLGQGQEGLLDDYVTQVAAIS